MALAKYQLQNRKTWRVVYHHEACDVQKELVEWLGTNGYDRYATDLMVSVSDYAREMYSDSIYWLDEDAEDEDLEQLDQRCYDSMTDEDYFKVLKNFFCSSTIRGLFKLWVPDENNEYQVVAA